MMTDREQTTFGELGVAEDIEDSNREATAKHIAVICEDSLPRQAESGGWPVRFGHCFRRLAYDEACDGDWRDEVRGDTFVESATSNQLGDALQEAARMLYYGKEYAWKLQEKSLLRRGEMKSDETEHVDAEEVL